MRLTSLRVMMLGCCPYLNRISTSSVGSLLALLMICREDESVETLPVDVVPRTLWADAYLDGILHARHFVYTALTDGVGAHTDVLFDLVGV